ncbi:uncharacterized protein B0T23DRAFT_433210 [Neurospora hispaniola]|uniref:Uncharacterized protein n=1 Tax=Neurospora hispaniola TaxID=588809 RepID=A0AAJ0MLL6_9PEZI|nr:hypothetical protein B0T23DRAFT_433210 [Neurospora hispaniola]
MPTLCLLLLLLFSTIFMSPAFSSAINLPSSHQSLSSNSSDSFETTTTTTSTAPTLPLANTKGIIPTPPVPPTIPSHPPGTDPSSFYESTDIHLDSPTQTSSSEPIFQPSSEPSFFQSDTLPSLPSLRPCTTTLTSNNNNNRPCPPPTWEGTLTMWPSTTTLLKPINCHGCIDDGEHDVEGGV